MFSITIGFCLRNLIRFYKLINVDFATILYIGFYNPDFFARLFLFHGEKSDDSLGNNFAFFFAKGSSKWSLVVGPDLEYA